MKNIGLLFEVNKASKNSFRNIKIRDGQYYYKSNATVLNGDEIKKLIQFISILLSRYDKVPIPISIDYSNIICIKDKLTYIILECICYYLIVEKKSIVKIFLPLNCGDIFTEGVEVSSLSKIIGKKNPQRSFDAFKSNFLFDLKGTHYRKVINGNIDISSDYLSKIMFDIEQYLQNINIEEKYSVEISSTLSELIGNAIEHTKTDCLVDIDVAEGYYKKSTGNLEYYGINIVVLNFSKKLFGDSLQYKINNMKLDEETRYNKVIDAYNNHRRKFNEQYIEEDFYNIASYQHKISGAPRKITDGGKGLTSLIASLERYSDTHKCYMMTGKRILVFMNELLKMNEDRWIGFNEENDFICYPPDKKCIKWSKVNLPGTAYNLHFVMRKEE